MINKLDPKRNDEVIPEIIQKLMIENFSGGMIQKFQLADFAKSIVRECAKIAKKEQEYNDRHEIHVNIDQCILIEFGL